MCAQRNSILCPNCRKLISADEPACPYCGLNRPGLHNAAGVIRKILFGADPVMAVIVINVALFVLALLLDPQAVFGRGGLFNFLAPSGQSLFLLGASGTIPVLEYNRYWSLVSASFLHGGILHIIFNMLAFYQLGPFILREYGFHRFFNLYLITGMVGFAASVLAGVSFTIGASASVCGLIGAIIYYGKSRGGHYGEAIFKQAMGWVAGLILFGMFFSGINNWAHGGGLLSGIFLAWLMGYNDQKPEVAAIKLLAYALILITAAILIWSAVYSLLYVYAPFTLQ